MTGDKEIKETSDPVQAIRDNLGAAQTKLTEEDQSESGLIDDLMGEVSGASNSSTDDTSHDGSATNSVPSTSSTPSDNSTNATGMSNTSDSSQTSSDNQDKGGIDSNRDINNTSVGDVPIQSSDN